MKQLNYNFAPDLGIAGGLYDLTGYVCDSFCNAEKDGVLKHGMGIVTGSAAGIAALPTKDSTISNFEGILVNGLTTEHSMDGSVVVKEGTTVGVLKQGRIWARVAADAVPANGKAVYFIIKGDNAGLFTTSDDDTNASNAIAINAKFIGGKGSSDVAPVELYPTMVVPSSVAQTNNTGDQSQGGADGNS